MKRRNKILGALYLLVLFVMYQASITAFTHVHYINGVLITHSHPFQGKHTHSKTALVVIDRLATFHSLEVDVYETPHPLRFLLALLQVQSTTPIALGETVQLCSPRAPPTV